jgi:hypothetical protein
VVNIQQQEAFMHPSQRFLETKKKTPPAKPKKPVFEHKVNPLGKNQPKIKPPSMPRNNVMRKTPTQNSRGGR